MFSRGQTEQGISASADFKGPGTALIARGCNDFFDHFSQGHMGRLGNQAVGGHRSLKALDLAAESLGQVWKQGDDLFAASQVGSSPIRLSLVLLEFDKLGAHGGCIGAVGDGSDQAFDLALQSLCLLGDAKFFPATISALLHEAFSKLVGKGLERIFIEQSLFEAGNHPLLETRGIDLSSAVTAGAAAIGAAGHVFLVGNDHGAAADATTNQTGQQALGASCTLRPPMPAITNGPSAQPGFLIDDA